jgi:hypothetical protein
VGCPAEPIILHLPGNEEIMKSKQDAQLYVGIDIAAQTFSAAWGSSMNQIGSAQTFEKPVYPFWCPAILEPPSRST